MSTPKPTLYPDCTCKAKWSGENIPGEIEHESFCAWSPKPTLDERRDELAHAFRDKSDVMNEDWVSFSSFKAGWDACRAEMQSKFDEANLNASKVIMEMQAEIKQLKEELAFYKNGTKIKEVYCDEEYAIENKKLREALKTAINGLDEECCCPSDIWSDKKVYCDACTCKNKIKKMLDGN